MYLELYQFHNSNLHSVPELFGFFYKYQYHISIEEGYIRLNQMHVLQKVPFVLCFVCFCFLLSCVAVGKVYIFYFP